jgi:phosphoribosylcarboxyaminoimidazole (NCAIR) mutase
MTVDPERSGSTMSNKPLKKLIAGAALAAALTGITYAATPAAADPAPQSNPVSSVVQQVVDTVDSVLGINDEPEHD